MEWPMAPTLLPNLSCNQNTTTHFKHFEVLLPPATAAEFFNYKLTLNEIDATCKQMAQCWPIWPMEPTPLLNPPCHYNMSSHFTTSNAILPLATAAEFGDYKL